MIAVAVQAALNRSILVVYLKFFRRISYFGRYICHKIVIKITTHIDFGDIIPT